MDKGIKGLVTGDLSVFIVQQIQTSIEKFKHQFEQISNKIEDLLEKKTTLEQFYGENFSMDSSYSKNQPGYE